jgi:purine nucleosidase
MRLSLPLFLLLASLAWSKPPVVLSTDVGNEIDDQWAIAYLLVSGNFDVQGLLAAQAPSLPSPSAHATYKILVDEVENRLGLREHPPLLEGSSIPLSSPTAAEDSDAMHFLIDTSKTYSKDHRLIVLTIGAATDVASAILADPTIVDRIEVVAMGFKNLSSEGGKEFNVQNDPIAWRVILQSTVPVTIGSADVCRANLAMPFDKAAALLANSSIGAWLWQEYRDWYFRFVKPLRVDDFSKPSIIWDIITLAYVEGIATHEKIARPVLGSELSFDKGSDPSKTIDWITAVDSAQLWKEFAASLNKYEKTHAIPAPACYRN